MIRTYETTVGVAKTGGISMPTPEEWLENTGFTERAAADAKANQPAADATEPPATLIDLHTVCHKRAQLNVTVAEQALQDATTAVTETRIDTLDPGMAEAQIQDGLVKHGEQKRGDLQAKSEEAGKRLRDLNAYKHARDIEREATGAANKADAWATLGIVVGIEAFINALFFKDTGTGGILGGFALTVVVSGVNVMALGFLAGLYAAPWAFSHSSARMRGLGWAALVTAAIVAFGLNLFVSHFRDAGLTTVNVDFKTIAPILFQPWRWLAYHELTSLVLFFVGIACAALGFLKGYRFDDPIWGYGPITRAYKDAEEEHRELVAEVSDEMQAIMTRKADAMKALVDAQAATVQEHRRALADVERTITDRQRAIIIGDQALARAQHTYFEINRRIRAQAIMPVWANTPPTFAHLADDLPNLDALKAIILEEETVLAANRKVVVDFIRGLPKLREAVINDFLMRIRQADFKAVPTHHLGPQRWDEMFKTAAE